MFTKRKVWKIRYAYNGITPGVEGHGTAYVYGDDQVEAQNMFIKHWGKEFIDVEGQRRWAIPGIAEIVEVT